jgi:UDP-N-acetylmuramoyl-L-alanyl-D-glutamate--2,6-diaminopimelate ligase
VLLAFGCGGDRDAGKRPQMGAIAAKRADQVFVTDDNPRSENPAKIRRDIIDACPDALEFDDRRAAIEAAIESARVGDIILVAGKGHEQGQIIEDTILPFDDVSVIAELIGLEASS